MKSYLKSLKKKQLEEQLLDLYVRFGEVKTYYNFVFNPKEDELLEEAKFKIRKEYFPVNSRKPKARRSVAQNLIKHYLKLGVEANIVADIMLFNIEIAQCYAAQKEIKQEGFYKSMAKSFDQAIELINESKLNGAFKGRILKIVATAKAQDWINADELIEGSRHF